MGKLGSKSEISNENGIFLGTNQAYNISMIGKFNKKM